MTVPKYVGIYFTAGVRTSKDKVLKRLKSLEESGWGYKTSEYKDLKRYARALRNQAFSKTKYYNRKKKEKGKNE